MVTLTVYQTVVNTVFMELVISKGITIYEDFPATQIRPTEIAEIYLRLWENDGFTVRVFPEKWIPINILPDVKINAVKIYPLEPADRQIVDEIFNKLHMQKRMEFTTQPTFHGYPIFVVWKTIRRERKKRVVINIRGFYNTTIIDLYPMPLQSNIIAAVTGC